MNVVSKIIQTEIIDKMPLTIEVVSIDELILSVCTTAWVRIGTRFKDSNDVEFKVTDFVHNETITVNELGFVGNITLTKPHFMWGTRVQTNNEYHQKASYSEDKLPMIWLQDGAISDRKDKNSSVGADISCNIYFLDTYNEVWINDEIALNSLSPMKSLSTQFKKALENNYTFFQSMNGYSEVENTRFGSENDNGIVNRHFGDDLSGVGVRLAISSYTDEECCGLIDTNVLPTCANGTVNILNSNSDLIKSVNVGSGQTESTQINDTAIKVVNTNGDIVKTQISLGGAVSAEVEIPDMTITVNYGGTETDFQIVPFGGDEITLNFI